MHGESLQNRHSQVSKLNAKTFRVLIDADELAEHAFLDKKVVRAKGVISVQIDAETTTMTICAANKDCEGIRDLLDSFEITVSLDDVEEVADDEDKENATSSYGDPCKAYNDPNVRKQKMLSRVNRGSAQARLDAKMKDQQKEEQRGWLGSLLGW